MQKFNVIKKLVVESKSYLPEYFLSDSAVEAEKLYKEFDSTLNGFAYSYSIATGLDKSDLFCEALIELAESRRDFDPERSDNFKSYAIFRIKDVLNIYVRKNASAISIPNYIKKANTNIITIKDILIKYEKLNYGDSLNLDSLNSVDFETLSNNDSMLLKRAVKSLKNAASRCNTNLEKFIRRAEYIPIYEEYNEESVESKETDREIEKLNASLIVNDLKKHMTPVELEISNGIMEGKSLKQIGDDFNRTSAWVSRKLGNMRKKLSREI